MSHFRFRPLLLSLAFLVASLGAYQLVVDHFQPKPTIECRVTADSPAGTWKQYVIDNGTPIYLATFRFEQAEGDYRVTPIDIAPITFPQSDFRTFGHRFDGMRWGFHSDWHQYGTAWFELRKTAPDRFEGYAFLDGKQRPNRHILVRVGP